MANTNHVISINLQANWEQFKKEGANFAKEFTDQFKSATGNGSFLTASYLEGLNLLKDAVKDAFGAIKDQMKGAMEYQNNLINQTGNFQNLFKLTYSQANDLARKFNKADALNNIALPFSPLRNQLKQSVGDDFLGTFYDANNVDGSIKRTTSLLGKLAVALGGTSGTSQLQQNKFAQSFLSAPTPNSLSRLEVWQNNPQLQRSLEDAQKELGIQFKGANRNQRVNLLENVINRVITPQMISKFGGTLDNYLDTIKVQLSDPEIGAFSFIRELQPGKVNSSVIGAVTGLFKAASQIDGSGFKSFADSLLGFAIGEINTLTNALSGGFGSGLLKGGGAIGSGIFDGIKIGIIGIEAAVGGVLAPLDAMLKYFGILTPALQVAATGFTVLITAASANLAFGWIAGLTESMVGLAAVGWVAIGDGVLLAAQNFSYATLAVSGFDASLLALAFNPVVLGGAAVLAAIGAAGWVIWKYWNPLSELFSSFFSGLVEGIGAATPLLKQFQGAIGTLANFCNAVGGAFNNMVGGINSATGAMERFIGVQSQAHFSPGTLGGAKSAGEAIGGVIGRGLSGGAKNFIPGYGLGHTLGLFADGNNLGQKLSQERRLAPIGSNAMLAVIHSGEAVLNETQQADIRKGGSGVNIAPTINIHVSGSSEHIVATIEQNLDRILNKMYVQAKNSMI